MGLTSGSVIEMQGVAPMGDPRDQSKRLQFILRNNEAAAVTVEVIE
jgi:Fe2+ transport system protein FeoA